MQKIIFEQYGINNTTLNYINVKSIQACLLLVAVNNMKPPTMTQWLLNHIAYLRYLVFVVSMF